LLLDEDLEVAAETGFGGDGGHSYFFFGSNFRAACCGFFFFERLEKITKNRVVSITINY
jgi:hypothetical protein